MRKLVLTKLILFTLLSVCVVVATGYAESGSDAGSATAHSNSSAAPLAAASQPPGQGGVLPAAPTTPLQEVTSTAPAHDNSGTAKTTPQPSLQPRNPYYALRINDVFEISFPFSPEFNETVRIPPDGWVPLIGVRPVHLAGETTPQATAIVRKAYAGVLHDPEIMILLKEFEKPYFIVSGEVGKPGKYDLLGDTTLTQALAIAGGIGPHAKHSDVVLFRRVADDWTEVEKVDVKKMLASKNLAEDPHLRPGDLLYVPKSAMSKIKEYLPNYGTGLYPTIP